MFKIFKSYFFIPILGQILFISCYEEYRISIRKILSSIIINNYCKYVNISFIHVCVYYYYHVFNSGIALWNLFEYDASYENFFQSRPVVILFLAVINEILYGEIFTLGIKFTTDRRFFPLVCMFFHIFSWIHFFYHVAKLCFKNNQFVAFHKFFLDITFAK